MDTKIASLTRRGIGAAGAGDMMVVLNGSKFVGKVQSEAFSRVSKINRR